MAIKLIDNGAGLDEAAKAIPAAIKGYYDAQDREMKKKMLAAQMMAQEDKKERQQAQDVLRLQEMGYEVPAGTEDPMGLLKEGMLSRKEGFITDQDIKRSQVYANYQGQESKNVDTDLKREKLKQMRTQKPLTEGQTKLENEYAKEYNEFINAGGYTGLDSAVSELEESIEKIKDLKPDKLSAMTGAATGGLVGGEAFSIQQNIEKVIQGSLRETLGAQFTENEAKQLMARTYNPKLGWEENYDRAVKELEKIKSKAEAKKRAAQHFEEFGEISSFKGFSASKKNKRDLQAETPLEDSGGGGNPWEDF